jgi:IS605 OrfB family transposase
MKGEFHSKHPLKKEGTKLITAVQFRLFPSPSQEKGLNAICTIYNKMRRVGYKLLFNNAENIQQKLMTVCKNNSYVNTILSENEMRLKQQETWLKKKKAYLASKIKVIQNKIEQVKAKDEKDKRLKGLYSRLSSIMNRLANLKLEPIVFGSKQLFRERLLQKISRAEFKMKRDASFKCTGKAQYRQKNPNLKILPDQHLKIRTFRNERGKKWLKVPFSVNQRQAHWLKELEQADKYTATVKRKLVKGKIQYYLLISYEVPVPELRFSHDNGIIGIDANYNFATLANVDKEGHLLSYQKITYRNINTYRKNKRNNHASYQADKILNVCLNKRKPLVIEDLALEQSFSYNKSSNRKLANFKKSILGLLERKCIKKGVPVLKVPPHYTSIIGQLKYARSYNLSIHYLASYVIARRGLGFEEALPTDYEWLLSQVGDLVKPRLKKSSTYYNWARIHDFFKQSGMTSFRPSEVVRKVLLGKNGLNSVTNVQPDNLRAGLSKQREIDDYHKFWSYINNPNL